MPTTSAINLQRRAKIRAVEIKIKYIEDRIFKAAMKAQVVSLIINQIYDKPSNRSNPINRGNPNSWR